MSLYQSYLNWRIERTRNALARMEKGFYESSEKMGKTRVRVDECIVCNWDTNNLMYLRRIGELKEKEGRLVAKLSQAGGN